MRKFFQKSTLKMKRIDHLIRLMWLWTTDLNSHLNRSRALYSSRQGKNNRPAHYQGDSEIIRAATTITGPEYKGPGDRMISKVEAVSLVQLGRIPLPSASVAWPWQPRNGQGHYKEPWCGQHHPSGSERQSIKLKIILKP